VHWFMKNIKRKGNDLAVICNDFGEWNGRSYSQLFDVSVFMGLGYGQDKITFVPPSLHMFAPIPTLLSGIIQGETIFMSGRCPEYIRLADNPLFEKAKLPIVIISSGSTGKPKMVVHDLEKILEFHKGSKKKLRTIAFLKFDHIGGLNTVLYTLSAGGTLIVPQTLSVEHVCEAIQEHKAELLPCTPSFLNLLILSGAYKKYDLSSLKIISFGTEPMSDTLLDTLRKIFPDVKLKQLYGMSEIGILPNKTNPDDPNFIKLKDDMKIVDGKLFVKSPMSMIGYIGQDSPIDSDGWMETGDIVEESNGYIRILGRDDDVINVGGLKVYPAEVEEELMRFNVIDDAAVYAVPSAILGQTVACNIVLGEAAVAITDPIFHEMMIKAFPDDKYKRPMTYTVVDSVTTDRGKKVRHE